MLSSKLEFAIVLGGVLVFSLLSINHQRQTVGLMDLRAKRQALEVNSSFQEIVDRSWNPRRFSDNLRLNVDRGLHIVNCWSGAAISSWIFVGTRNVQPNWKMWSNQPKEKIIVSHIMDIPKILANDTIFVPFVKLREFTKDFLPHIEEDFVLISTPWLGANVTGMDFVALKIVEHPKLLRWFASHVSDYTGGYEYHPKVSPFPLGLKPKMPGARAAYRNPVPTFRKIFMETLNSTIESKTQAVFAGYIRQTNAIRKIVPRGPNLPYDKYLRKIAEARYVLSPNGLHPDCHRNYEAIGMGSVPITQLDPVLFRHFKEGPVIYNNSNWNVSDLALRLPHGDEIARVNRNLIFEEYWMEYIERDVGRPMRWWDVVSQERCRLDDFAKTLPAVVPQ